MSTGKILLATLAGLAAGAAVGVLFAPDKGSQTRKKISDKSGEVAGNLKKKYNGAIDSLTQKLDAVSEKYDEGRVAAQAKNTI